MICYKDKTFCSFFKECSKGHDCHRALTIDVINNALKSNLPVCEFSNKPDCFIDIKELLESKGGVK